MTSPTELHTTSAAAAPDTAGDTSARARTRRRRRRWAVVAAVVAIGALAGTLGVRWLRPYLYHGAVLQAPDEAPSMEGLHYTDGTPVDLSALRGDVVVVYFGYTHCPDICPTTLAAVSRALDDLGGDADDVHVLVLTIDPERDTDEVLEAYVGAFDERIRGVSGDLASIERVASLYGVYFAKGEAMADGYAMDHTATLMGIDPDGHLRIVWPNEVTAADLASDLDELR